MRTSTVRASRVHMDTAQDTAGVVGQGQGRGWARHNADTVTEGRRLSPHAWSHGHMVTWSHGYICMHVFMGRKDRDTGNGWRGHRARHATPPYSKGTPEIQSCITATTGKQAGKQASKQASTSKHHETSTILKTQMEGGGSYHFQLIRSLPRPIFADKPPNDITHPSHHHLTRSFVASHCYCFPFSLRSVVVAHTPFHPPANRRGPPTCVLLCPR